MVWHHVKAQVAAVFVGLFFAVGVMSAMQGASAMASTERPVMEKGFSKNLQRAEVYLAAGDYRRAVQSCQREIDEAPSVESYVYLTYVYHAIDGYMESLAKKDEWGKIGQLSLSFTSRGTYDLVDPPDILARMAKELLHEGLRQQFDLTASMANRLDKARVDLLWQQQAAWQKANPDTWWAGIPKEWAW